MQIVDSCANLTAPIVKQYHFYDGVRYKKVWQVEDKE